MGLQKTMILIQTELAGQHSSKASIASRQKISGPNLYKVFYQIITSCQMHICSHICSFCYLGQSILHSNNKIPWRKQFSIRVDNIKIITAAATLSFLTWSSFANAELTEERINMLGFFCCKCEILAIKFLNSFST